MLGGGARALLKSGRSMRGWAGTAEVWGGVGWPRDRGAEETGRSSSRRQRRETGGSPGKKERGCVVTRRGESDESGLALGTRRRQKAASGVEEIGPSCEQYATDSR
uniref:Uncharacterized protein n=1 Tax=Knipowitschia caucasica TaxID=637954 RepID=A0AAV2IU96_KNICA